MVKGKFDKTSKSLKILLLHMTVDLIMAKESLYANFKLTYLKQRETAICNIFNFFRLIIFYNILFLKFQIKQGSKLKLSIHVKIDIGFNILKNLRPLDHLCRRGTPRKRYL